MARNYHRSLFFLAFAVCQVLVACQDEDSDTEIPYYVYPCQRSDPDVDSCLTYAANHLASHFREGIPELDIDGVEPVTIDEIQLALGGGPDGYRAIFKDIRAYGVSNLTVTAVRTDLDTHQFQLSFYVPHITGKAWFRSQGVLFLMKASGGGDYEGQYDGVRAKVYFRAKPHQVGDHVYLSVEEMKMDFSVEKIAMEVTNTTRANAVVDGALNLMINTHSQELLTEMKPSLRKDLTEKMRLFTANVLARIPYDTMVTND